MSLGYKRYEVCCIKVGVEYLSTFIDVLTSILSLHEGAIDFNIDRAEKRCSKKGKYEKMLTH